MTVFSLKYELIFEMREKSENIYFYQKEIFIKSVYGLHLTEHICISRKMSKKYRHLIYLLISFIKCQAIGYWVGLTA